MVLVCGLNKLWMFFVSLCSRVFAWKNYGRLCDWMACSCADLINVNKFFYCAVSKFKNKSEQKALSFAWCILPFSKKNYAFVQYRTIDRICGFVYFMLSDCTQETEIFTRRVQQDCVGLPMLILRDIVTDLSCRDSIYLGLWQKNENV